MRIGVDFDNTIVRYDEVFHRVALERGLITAEIPVSKGAVRDHLRRCGKEDDWTAMQGYVYGQRMQDAQAFPGVLEFFRRMVSTQIPICIISHKTRYPYQGPRYDLHAAAWGWLEQQGFFDRERIGLSRNAVYLESTLADKLSRIGSVGCTHFIDDLPELLEEPGFPGQVARLLFDPANAHAEKPLYRRVPSWAEATHELKAA
ncbi:MAG: haloacid dehalogenase-like hydrolase [Planctomycetales bacterium]